MKLNVVETYLDITEAAEPGIYILPIHSFNGQQRAVVYEMDTTSNERSISRRLVSDWFSEDDKALILKEINRTEWLPGHPDFSKFEIKFAGLILVPEEDVLATYR